jgi:hypothetical protein
MSPALTTRRANIYFNITSPTPGTFVIALHFKGRDKPILEMDLKTDDLLEKVSLVGQITASDNVGWILRGSAGYDQDYAEGQGNNTR